MYESLVVRNYYRGKRVNTHDAWCSASGIRATGAFDDMHGDMTMACT